MERKMVSVNISGRMEPHMKAIGWTVKSMASELTGGQTIASLLVSGSTARLEDSVFTHGLMDDAMRASSSETRDKAMEST